MNSADFRLAMAALPEPPDTGEMPPHWSYWRRQVWKLGQSDDVANFWNWPAVYHCMLVNHFPIGQQLVYLQQDWPRWEPIVSNRSNESDYRNMVNQCAHLKLWEDTTNTRVGEMDSILEFGGGYGAMACACRQLGFSGTYYIHDLPEFRLLQQWWLETQGVEVVHVDGPQMVTDLTIAIYSLSETPLGNRNAWMNYPESYLLLSSNQWADIDNGEWMADIMRVKSYMQWQLIPFEGRPDSYLIGWPK